MESVRWAFNFSNWRPKQHDWAFALSLIQSEEKERIQRFIFKKDAKASLIGRLMLRKFASSTLELPWSVQQFSRTEKGRPYLTNSLPSHCIGVDFNVSHQGDWVVLAAELGPKVGVDVMKVEKAANKNTSEFFRLMRRQFTTAEWNAIKLSEDENVQLAVFYRHWCLKESVVKAVGVGIGYDLQRISFTIPTIELNSSKIISDTSVSIDGELDRKWNFEETLLDKMHPVAVSLLWDKGFNIQNSRYVERENMKFEVLSFEELIEGSVEITKYDSKLGEEFHAKEESPWK